MSSRRLATFIDVSLLGLACLACYAMGKDLNMDMLTYHLYLAHAYWTGSHAHSFMGAGGQSYINPLGYLPFYAMVRAEWHSVTIAFCLAASAATALLVLWRIGQRWLFAGHPHALALAMAGALLGGLSPLFLATLGTSFLDPLQAALFCLALFLAALGIERNNVRWWIASGVVLGIATGLKLSFIHLAATTLFATLLVPGQASERFRRWLATALGLSAGGLVTAGPWAWYLYREYGNPVFPLANSLFRSPDFPPVSVSLDRFMPESWLDLFTLPWRMAALKSGVYAEIAVPDLRFALLVLLGLAASVVWWLRKRQASGQFSGATAASPADEVARRVRMFFSGVFVLGYCAMTLGPGNGRYFMPLFLLAGPLLVWLASLLLRNPRHLWSVLVIITLAQVIHGGAFHYRRWDQTAWTPRWLDLEVPENLRQTPHHYLFSGSESDTFVAAFLHPDSRYLMIQGKNPLSPNREGAQRVRDFIKKGASGLRVLVRESETRSSPLYRSATADPVTLTLINDDLAAWNLGVSGTGCQYIGVTLGPAADARGRPPGDAAWPREYSLLSCPVKEGSALDKEFHTRQARLEQLGDALAQACPALFPAPPSFPIRIGEVWFIRYAGSDVVVGIQGETAALTRMPAGPFNAPIGQVEALLKGQLAVPCRRLPRR